MKTQIEKIRDAIKEEKTKIIFDNLCQFFETKNYRFLNNAVGQCDIPLNPIWDFFQKLKEKHESGSRLILYGIGETVKNQYLLQKNYKESMGYTFYPFIGDVPWSCFVDKNHSDFKEEIYGHAVLSPEELITDYSDEIIVVGAVDYFDEIKFNLREILGDF